MDSCARWVVLVVGMHRSGTSLATQALSLLGADLPSRIMKADEHNRAGYFEPSAIVALHDRLLAAAKSSWSDWQKISSEWFASPECEPLKDELIAAIRADFGDSRLALIKDPRLGRILPLWDSILDKLESRPFFVFPYRNPIEVDRSLTPLHRLDAFQSHLLWLRHALDAEFGTRGHPRAFVSYEKMLKDPRSTFDHLVSRSPIIWPQDLPLALQEIESIVMPELRHKVAREDDPANDVPIWVRETYECYQALELNPSNKRIWKRLDRIRDSFDAGCEIFAPGLHSKVVALREAQGSLELEGRKVESLVAEVAARSREIEGLKEEVGSLRSEGRKIESLVAEVAACSREIEGLREEVGSLKHDSRAIESLVVEVSERSKEIEGLKAELGASEAKGAMLHATLSARSTELARTQAELSERSARVEALLQTLSSQSAEINGLQGELHSLRDANSSFQQELAARSIEGETLRAELTLSSAALKEAAVELQSVKEAFLRSHSWRLTAPLRWLSQHLFSRPAR